MTDVMERVKTYQQLIGGKFVDSASGETLEVINPADDQVIASVPKSAGEDVDQTRDPGVVADRERIAPDRRAASVAEHAAHRPQRGAGAEVGKLPSRPTATAPWTVVTCVFVPTCPAACCST